MFISIVGTFDYENVMECKYTVHGSYGLSVPKAGIVMRFSVLSPPSPEESGPERLNVPARWVFKTSCKWVKISRISKDYNPSHTSSCLLFHFLRSCMGPSPVYTV